MDLHELDNLRRTQALQRITLAYSSSSSSSSSRTPPVQPMQSAAVSLPPFVLPHTCTLSAALNPYTLKTTIIKPKALRAADLCENCAAPRRLSAHCSICLFLQLSMVAPRLTLYEVVAHDGCAHVLFPPHLQLCCLLLLRLQQQQHCKKQCGQHCSQAAEHMQAQWQCFMAAHSDSM
jgi:hypothetical protein